MEALQSIIGSANSILWGPPMLILLVGTHLYLTIRLRFIQRYIFKGIKLTFAKDKEAKGDVSQLSALTLSLASTLGTGNMIGVATAIALGGPGAVLWVWIIGLLGIATKFSEGLLAIKYRVQTSDGTMLGGPMYTIERGLKKKWMAAAFAIFAIVASFGIGNMVQANSITQSVQNVFHIPPLATGIFLSAITLLVVVGGIKSIARVAVSVVPASAIIFFIGCVIILFINYQYIGAAVALIVKSAFSSQAMGGGVVGFAVASAIRYGVARGLFSNEAGLGSSPIAAAAATTRNPVRQALVSMTQVFWDTIILNATIGILYVSSIIRYPERFINEAGDGLISGAALAGAVFEAIPVVGPYILAISIFLFAWTTILGWEYVGERCLEYLGGKKVLKPYRVVYGLVVLAGALLALELVWDIADAFNALMAVPNLISLLLLSGVIVAVTKEYLWSGNLDKIDETPIDKIDK